MNNSSTSSSTSNPNSNNNVSIEYSITCNDDKGQEAKFVFHEHGYKGGGNAIVKNFEEGNYIGVPVLQWIGMTTTSPENDDEIPFPAMKKWMRD